MRRARLLILAAWLLHSLAWFLPVVRGGTELPNGLPGWEAFRVAFGPIWSYQSVEYDEGWVAVLATASALTTVGFIFAAPLIVLRGPRRARRISGWIAAGAFILNSHWYVFFGEDRTDLRLGYFLWWFSFALLSVGLFVLAGGKEFRRSATA